MKTTLDNIQARESQYVLNTYRRQPVAFVRGKGPRLYDVDGREYLDFVSGIGVASLGHAHPGLAAAIADQATTLLHTSNLYYHPFQAEAAARLSALSGLSRAFFCNSGTEANEACLKFARRYWHTQGVKDRTGFVAIEHAFAGRTMGALSVTYDEHYRTPFQPLLGPVTFVDANSPDALYAAVSERTAAVIAEPIRGEGGVRPLSRAFSDAIADVCRRTGTLLIADEVQTGLGRTGHPFHFQALGWAPDLVSVGKALGSGVPGRCGPGIGTRRTDDLHRRSRQHVWRKPAGHPRGCVLPGRIDGARPSRSRPLGWRSPRAAPADAGPQAPGHRRSARRRPHARSGAPHRRDCRRRSGA